MNIYLLFIIALVIGYFFGSLPGALIVGKIFYKKDVRTMGSGNLGATNVARSLGAWPGFFTLFFDFFKKYKLDVDKQLRQCYLNSIDVSTLH